jgi:hypothetical protein
MQRKEQRKQRKAEWDEGQLQKRNREKKKEEFPGDMENMLPGNSFPQICVVSVNSLWKRSRFRNST